MNAPLVPRPSFVVTLGGGTLSRPLANALSEAVLRQALGAPAMLELIFADLPRAEAGALAPGGQIELSAQGTRLFAGEITGIGEEIEPDRGRLFRATARDPLHRLACRQSLLTLQDASAETLAQRLAGDIGLSVRCREPAPKRAVLVQHEETDLDFLADIAAEAGLYPVVRGEELALLSLAGNGEGETALALGRNLLACRLALRADRALPGGRIASRDPVTLAPRDTRLTRARQEARGAGGLETGARALLGRLAASDGEAEALLQGSLDRAAADLAQAEGLAEGDPALIPGRKVRIEGAAEALSGAYILTRAVHRFSAAEGYVTEFSTERPQRPPRARGPHVALGKIARIDDPQKLGRCEVELPDHGGLNAGWMHAIAPGAGARRGIVALPDQGDDVLILFPEGDLARGLILGGAFGTKRLPRGAEEKPRGIFLRSGDGQALELKGSDGTTRLSNRSGSSVELRPGRLRIAAASDLVIEAPGKTITIRADAVKFERG